MTKSGNVAQIPARLYELLAPLSAEERIRVVQATMILFGDEAPPAAKAAVTPSAATVQPPSPNEPQAFFHEKRPKNKGEELAVAARYLELFEKAQSHSKADFQRIIVAARRNFDGSHFARDINNAKRQAGFFNLGTGRGTSSLSYYGQQFVDALPDRAATSKLKRPKVGGSRKKKGDKKAR